MHDHAGFVSRYSAVHNKIAKITFLTRYIIRFVKGAIDGRLTHKRSTSDQSQSIRLGVNSL